MRTKETVKSYDGARGLGTSDGAEKFDGVRGSKPRVRIRGAAQRLFRAGSRPLRFGRL